MRATALALLVCAQLVRPGTSLLIPSAQPGSLPARQCVRLSAPAAHSRLCPPVLCAAKDRALPSISSPEVALGVGSALLLILVGNRLVTEELLNSQSRADLIATAGATVLLLEALTRLDITPREAEPVPLAPPTPNPPPTHPFTSPPPHRTPSPHPHHTPSPHTLTSPSTNLPQVHTLASLKCSDFPQQAALHFPGDNNMFVQVRGAQSYTHSGY